MPGFINNGEHHRKRALGRFGCSISPRVAFFVGVGFARRGLVPLGAGAWPPWDYGLLLGAVEGLLIWATVKGLLAPKSFDPSGVAPSAAVSLELVMRPTSANLQKMGLNRGDRCKHVFFLFASFCPKAETIPE